MTAPAKGVSVRVRALRDPELVSLIDAPDGPYADSPDGWWTERGGALDIRSGVVYFPPGSNPPLCSLPECSRCGGG